MFVLFKYSIIRYHAYPVQRGGNGGAGTGGNGGIGGGDGGAGRLLYHRNRNDNYYYWG